MISIKNVNRVWLLLVLTHVGGSLLAAYSQVIPKGGFILGLAVGLLGGWLVSGGKWYFALAGAAITAVFIHLSCVGLPAGYKASLLLLLMEMDLILWLRAKNYISLREYCHIQPITPAQLAVIPAAGLAMYVFCAYFNALSELVFRNYVTSSLSVVGQNPIGSLIIFALVPAMVEEIFFRGIFFRGLGAGKLAVIITALLFALMHMNFNQMCYAFAAGLVLAIAIRLTGNLTISAGMHFVFNSLSVLIVYLGDSRLVQSILGIHLGAYYPLMPIFYQDGHVLTVNLVVGLIVALLSLLLLVALLRATGRKEASKQHLPAVSWTGPDWAMITGCVICFAFALSRELL